MTDHRTGTREEWLAARLELLDAEKELTRRGDELARLRQQLPWVAIEKEYRFETDEGTASLADLFEGRSQLLVYHFMFGPDFTAGARPARRSPMASPARSCTWSTTTSPSRPCRERRWRSCRTTSGGWAGAFPGRPRSRATSTTTFTRSHTEQEWQSGAVEYNFRTADFRPSEESAVLIEIAAAPARIP